MSPRLFPFESKLVSEPSGYNHLSVSEELEGFPAVTLQIAEQGVTGASEREEGHGSCDADVYADHAGFDTILEFPDNLSAIGVQAGGVGKATSLMISMASSRVSTWIMATTGPKISSLAMVMSGVTLSKMVGPIKKPLGWPSTLTFRPSRTRLAPSAMPFSM